MARRCSVGTAPVLDRGQSPVEVALLLPFVVLLLLAVVQVGLVVRDQVLVTHAAREAARAAAVDPEPRAATDAAASAADLAPARIRHELRERGEKPLRRKPKGSWGRLILPG